MWGGMMPLQSGSIAPKRKGQPAAALRDASKLQPTATQSQCVDDSKQYSDTTITEYFEPCVDGPPSPERLRQLSKQMKRSSHLHRPYGHRTASSASSSVRSFTGDRADRPAWEHALDNISLVRRPSDRSTESSVPSSSRPESVQVFGKNIFSLKGRSKRESSTHSSSGSSLYSNEIPADGPGLGLKDSAFMPTIFNRRKQSRDESVQRRLQISGPFNFQHVTHTERDNPVEVQGEYRVDLTSKPLPMRPQPPTSVPSSSEWAPNALDAHSRNLSTGSVYLHKEGSPDASARPPLIPRHTAPASGARRLVKHARSQDYLRASPPRQAPPRPPRSPVEPTSAHAAPPIPPPRLSSRMSLRPELNDALAAAPLDRPQTSGGFRRPQPFSPDDAVPLVPPATSHGFQSSSEPDVSPAFNEHRFSHALTTPDDVAWPLAAGSSPSGFETPLPDVPEEEEQVGASRQSRLSMASNSSSLRASQSAPMLRSLTQGQHGMTGVDEGSEGSEIFEGEHLEDAPLNDSWEDVIDYCYDHEAEADCDYQWERPSLDTYRQSSVQPSEVSFVDELAEVQPATKSEQSSPVTQFASRPDLVSLSPSGQSPTVGAFDVGASRSHALATTGNFSLPRSDKRAHRPSMLKTTRPISCASSFKESHGFTLSPSLLIPGDYHQEMLVSESEKREYHDISGVALPGYHEAENEVLAAHGHDASHLNEQRSSTSTTETNSTSHSMSTGERHTSANSTWTSLTRLTASTTSLNKLAETVDDAAESIPPTQFAGSHDDGLMDEETTPPATKDTVPDLQPFPTSSFGRKSHHKSHASESVVRDEVPPMRSADASKTRRSRARTTSLSAAQAPPVGQYALFPKTHIKATGDRI